MVTPSSWDDPEHPRWSIVGCGPPRETEEHEFGLTCPECGHQWEIVREWDVRYEEYLSDLDSELFCPECGFEDGDEDDFGLEPI